MIIPASNAIHDSSDDRNAVERLAQEFVERYRRGERPSLREYTDRYPDMADEIRDVFPALLVLENLKPVEEDEPLGDLDDSSQRHPKQIGDYRIIREVGRGGMGIVYEAEQISLGRRVALKVLPRQMLLDRGHRQRFEREARAAARLHHTNIVPVFGNGEQDGLHYNVMQFIQGCGLDQLLEELKQMPALPPASGQPDGQEKPYGAVQTVGPASDLARSLLMGTFDSSALAPPQDPDPTASRELPPEAPEPQSAIAGSLTDTATARLSDTHSFSHSAVLPGQWRTVSPRDAKSRTYWRSVAHVGVQVASALQYAHDQGILHRDIKPANLLLDLRGTVWVTDFGLAKANDQLDITRTGDIFGTLRYMPPEAFEGKMDPRSDVYSLGLTLYELLALKPAFNDRDRHKLFKQVTTADAPRLERLNPQIPRDLAMIVHKAMDRDRARRYQSATEMQADLERFVADEPVRARPLPLRERCWRWCRHNPAVAGFWSVLFLGLTLLTSALSFAYWQESAHRHEIEKKNLAIEKSLESEKTAKEAANEAKVDATERLYHSLVEQARANRLSRRIGQRFETLETVRKAAALARQLGLPEERFLELRNEAIAALALPDLRVAKEWSHDNELGVYFDAALERYACVDQDHGTVEVWRVGEKQPTCSLTGINPWNLSIELSLDGAYLAVNEPGRALVHVWKLAGAKPSRLFSEPTPGGVCLSPDSRQLVLQEPDGTLALYDLATNTKLRRTPNVPRVSHIVWHPSSARLALAGHEFAQVLDLHTDEILWHKELAPQAWRHVAWHPDGATLAVMDSGSVWLWDVGQDKQVGRLEGSLGGESNFTFNPAGTLLASHAWDGILRLFDPLTGKQLFSAHANQYALQFSADGRFLAAMLHDHKLHIMAIAAGSEYRTLTASPLLEKRAYGGGAISANGRLLAASSGVGGSLGVVSVWDLPSGKEIAVQHDSRYVAFENGPPRKGAEVGEEETLLTTGRNGLVRQSLRFEQEGRAVHIGPAESLGVPLPAANVVQSLDGQVLVCAQKRGAVVRDADQPDKLINLESQNDVRHVGVSPDGRWVATGQWGYPRGIKIWERKALASGLTYEFVKDLPSKGLCRPVFSPDGNRLLASAGSDVPVRRFDVEGWVELPFAELVAGQNPAFSPDGKLVALETGTGAAQLVDAETGHEYARLEDPDQHRTNSFAFTADGATLACASTDGYCVHVWDLRMIRDELALMQLDWDLPAYPPIDAKSLGPVTSVVIEPSDSASWRARGELFIRNGETANAAEAMGHAFELAPNDVLLGRWWASLLLESGDTDGFRRACARLRELFSESEPIHLSLTLILAPEAVPDAESLIELATKGVTGGQAPWGYTALAGAELRNGRYERALSSLDESDRLAGSWWDSRTVNDILRAMALLRLGRVAEARPLLERASQYCDEHFASKPGAPFGDLTRGSWQDWYPIQILRREAEALLRAVETSDRSVPPGP